MYTICQIKSFTHAKESNVKLGMIPFLSFVSLLRKGAVEATRHQHIANIYSIAATPFGYGMALAGRSCGLSTAAWVHKSLSLRGVYLVFLLSFFANMYIYKNKKRTHIYFILWPRIECNTNDKLLQKYDFVREHNNYSVQYKRNTILHCGCWESK